MSMSAPERGMKNCAATTRSSKPARRARVERPAEEREVRRDTRPVRVVELAVRAHVAGVARSADDRAQHRLDLDAADQRACADRREHAR
jgi:hypothetical protein